MYKNVMLNQGEACEILSEVSSELNRRIESLEKENKFKLTRFNEETPFIRVKLEDYDVMKLSDNDFETLAMIVRLGRSVGICVVAKRK